MWTKIKTPATPLKTREKQGENTFLFGSSRYAKEQYFEGSQGTCSQEQKRQEFIVNTEVAHGCIFQTNNVTLISYFMFKIEKVE